MQREIHGFPFKAMGSACEIVIASNQDPEELASVTHAAIEEVLRIEAKYSRYRADSIVSRINAAAGQNAVACDDETWNLLQFAEQLFDLSDGLFDITAGILRQAWDFKQAIVPKREQLEELCDRIDWTSCVREQQSIFLPKIGMEIDFGGFGKEYAADRAAMVLQTLGIKHGYVNLGGDIHFLGPKLDGSAWNIGIQHPRKKGELIASIPLQQGGLATSGDYEKYFELDGLHYCHILNPRSGMPVRYWASVSVVGPNSLIAGSYSTIAMLLEDKAIDFLKATDLKYFAVDSALEIQLKR